MLADLLKFSRKKLHSPMKVCKFLYKNEIKFGVIKESDISVYKNFDYAKSTNNSEEFENLINVKDIEKFLPPVNPSKIVCVGRNYAKHAEELGNEIPSEPLLFLKAPSSIISEGNFIEIPDQTERVEHEGEIGIVIKKGCKNILENQIVDDYIFGYICLNDVTARDLQRKDVQFARAKSFDTFCPISSTIETDLKVADPKITTKVNGNIKQKGKISEMIFNITFLIIYISKQMTLNPGDIIATGTPSGVSQLNPGDFVEVEIEGVGNLQNPVRRV